MIRLGVAGYGHRIHNMIDGPFRQIAPDLRVVGIVDPDREGARQRLAACDRDDAAFYDTLDEMVRHARLDALAVGTRCNLHAPYAIEAARYDLPLFLEKPIAVTMEQAQGIERAFQNSRCPVVVSFPLRVSPLCVLCRDYIAGGAVGEPTHLNAVNYVPYGTVYWERFYRHYDISHGLFLQKATHDFDYMMYLMGSAIVRVAAMGTWGRVFGGTKPAGLHCAICTEQATCLESPQNRQRNNSGGDRGDHPCLWSVDGGSAETGWNEDCSSALIEFANGAHGVYSQVFFARRDAAARGATVSGYMGTVSFDWYTNELRRVRHHAPFSATERAGEGASHFGGDIELARDFIGVIRGTAPSRTPIETGLRSVYACLAATESALQGQFTRVRQL